jgi:hypothetical protein
MQFQIVDVGMVVVRPFRLKFVYSLSSVLSKISFKTLVACLGLLCMVHVSKR